LFKLFISEEIQPLGKWVVKVYTSTQKSSL